MDGKWPSTIFTDLMDAAGTPAWNKWKADKKLAKLSPVDGPPRQHKLLSSPLAAKKTGTAAVLP